MKKKTPTKAEIRKSKPIFRGCLQYFPDALLAVSNLSLVANEQHNPGQPLHWDRSKSTDEADALVRHLMQYEEYDDDGMLHATKVAWRGLSLLQKELEKKGLAEISKYNERNTR